jgi:recombinational DNA repair protein RecR
VLPRNAQGEHLPAGQCEVKEVILATNFKAEGEATAHVIS